MRVLVITVPNRGVAGRCMVVQALRDELYSSCGVGCEHQVPLFRISIEKSECSLANCVYSVSCPRRWRGRRMWIAIEVADHVRRELLHKRFSIQGRPAMVEVYCSFFMGTLVSFQRDNIFIWYCTFQLWVLVVPETFHLIGSKIRKPRVQRRWCGTMCERFYIICIAD